MPPLSRGGVVVVGGIICIYRKSQPTLHYCAHSNRVVIGNCDKRLITGLCAGVSATELVDVVILLCSYLPAALIRECSE